MGELEATQLRRRGFIVAVDEPYQHYQFAGRADVLAWDLESAALLHIENRTALPDFQEAVGSYNAKRAYLADDLRRRLQLPRAWRSVTHVIACLWSSEVLRTLRSRRESLNAVCPDEATVFDEWWSGRPPAAGVRSTLVLLDPIANTRRRQWSPLHTGRIDPRYRGYVDAADAVTARR